MKKNAFTLAETIMTLFIIGLVVTAAIPAMTTRSFTDNTKLAVYCRNHAADVKCAQYVNSAKPFTTCGGVGIDNSCLFSNADLSIMANGTAAPYSTETRDSAGTVNEGNIDFSFNSGVAADTFWNYIHSEQNIPFIINNFIYKENGSNLYLQNTNNLDAFINGTRNVILGSFAAIPAVYNANFNNNTFLAGNTTISANNSIANNVVIGGNNTIGNNATQNTIVVGNNNNANFSNSLVVGSNNTLRLDNSLIIGNGIDTANTRFAIGNNMRILNGDTNTLLLDDDLIFNETTIQNITFDFSSDLRLKNILGPYTKGLNEILKVKPVVFTYKSDNTATEHVGVIAQEIQKIFPEAVEKMPNGFYAVNDAPLFFAMINALKELDEKTNAEERRKENLEKELNTLERELLELTVCRSNSFFDKIKCFIMRKIFDWRGI